MGRLQTILREAVALAPTDSAAALRVLDRGLEEMRASEERHAVAALSKHAGAISSGSGDYQTAARYYELALEDGCHETELFLGLGDAKRRIGDADGARRAFTRCHEQAVLEGDTEVADFAADALRRLGRG
jgi:tetratricopeptide (TPR) repeat protein